MRLCKGGCDRELVAAKEWSAVSLEDRVLLQPVQARHQGRGLCARCYQHHLRAGTLPDFERARADIGVVLEEWAHLADPALSIKANAEKIAPRVGMTMEALRSVIGRRARGEVAA